MGRVIVGAALLAASLAGGCASAPISAPSTSPMPSSNVSAEIPAGFVSFCIRFANQCSAQRSAAPEIALNDQNWRLLDRINRKVNDAIWPQDDEQHYGRSEYWTIPTDGYGDCDDYAVTKRKELIDAGFPQPALRLAVVYSPQSSRHAVLTVATDKGDLVLDNLSDSVLSWRSTGYTWIERQAASDPMKWVSLQRVGTAEVLGDAALTITPAGNTASVPLVLPPAAAMPKAPVRTGALADDDGRFPLQ